MVSSIFYVTYAVDTSLFHRIHHVSKRERSEADLCLMSKKEAIAALKTCMSDYRRDLDWGFDLLTAYTFRTRDNTLQITVTHRLVSSVYYGLH
jgi:predicted MarR family transcription regulator